MRAAPTTKLSVQPGANDTDARRWGRHRGLWSALQPFVESSDGRKGQPAQTVRSGHVLATRRREKPYEQVVQDRFSCGRFCHSGCIIPALAMAVTPRAKRCQRGLKR